MRTTSEIRAEIRAITPDWARLAARFEAAGINGLTMWDCERKIELSRLENIVRREAAKAGVKLTESAIDAQAHEAPAYFEFVDAGVDMRTRYLELNERRSLLLGELRVAESLEALHDVAA